MQYVGSDMFNTYYENYRFRETLPSYSLTLLFNYMLVFVLRAKVPLLLGCSMLQAFDWLVALLSPLIGSEPYVQHAESI